ncbi:hypothetical protein C357_08331 [Citreicella sp. 357]|nr:hypothetical protein C357_08331 [Citreicella sp. 357]
MRLLPPEYMYGSSGEKSHRYAMFNRWSDTPDHPEFQFHVPHALNAAILGEKMASGGQSRAAKAGCAILAKSQAF